MGETIGNQEPHVKGMEKQETALLARPQMAESTRKQATRTETHSRPTTTHPSTSGAVPMVCKSRADFSHAAHSD